MGGKRAKARGASLRVAGVAQAGSVEPRGRPARQTLNQAQSSRFWLLAVDQPAPGAIAESAIFSRAHGLEGRQEASLR